MKFLASPLERIAEEQFLASPFGFLADQDSGAFHTKVLKLISEVGLAATLSNLVREAVQAGRIDAASVEAFLEAAFDYDAQKKTGEDLRSFLEFVEHRVEQESETPGVVRVMTTHFSKGLGMDMVILPELSGKGLSDLRETQGISLHRNCHGEVEWGLSLPSKDICAADETLAAAREQLRARQAYENFCVLYVAMTRAKQALYCLHAPTKDIKNTGRWLQEFFPQGNGPDPDNRILGNPKWFESFECKRLEPVIIKGTKLQRPIAETKNNSPSSHEGEDIAAGIILGGGEARHLGTEVHELLAQVEWLGDAPDYSGSSHEAASLVRDFLQSPRAEILRKPEEKISVWRERSFDVQIAGHPVSGIFDRVHISIDGDGNPTSAQIYDFKTDKGPADLHAKYRDQLDAYIQSAALLLQIPVEKVKADPVAVRGE
jgi:ATP-dependent exoDNAse (exonuclease V) beta subunit